MAVIKTKDSASNKYLIGGVLVSLGASVCCVGPFILLATGISGAWMSKLMILEPYQPILALTVLSLFIVGGWKIFFPKNSKKSGESCLISQPSWQLKAAFFLAAGLSAILLSSAYWVPLLDQILMSNS